MIAIERNIVIHRPLEMVFAFVSSFRYDEQWRAGILNIEQHPANKMRVGARIHEEVEIVGCVNRMRAEITCYEPNRKVAFQSLEAALPTRGFRLVERTASGSRFTYQIEMEVNEKYRRIEPIIITNLSKRIEDDLRRLKFLLEFEGFTGHG